MSRYENAQPRKVMEPKEIAARNRRIVAAVKAGVPMADLRSRFDLGEETIRQICLAQGVRRELGRPSG